VACPRSEPRVGGVPELIDDGVDGFLEHVGDVSAQAARVVSLLTDEELYNRMSAAARHAAELHYSTALIIPQYEQYYREVCGL